MLNSIQILTFQICRFLQEPFTNAKFKGTFDAWMKGTGPAHLFIYYQRPYKVTDQGEIEEYRGGREEFFVTDCKSGFSWNPNVTASIL